MSCCEKSLSDEFTETFYQTLLKLIVVNLPWNEKVFTTKMTSNKILISASIFLHWMLVAYVFSIFIIVNVHWQYGALLSSSKVETTLITRDVFSLEIL